MKGFTLPELLVALLVSTLVLGAVLALVLPVQGLTQAQLETADLQQRLRVAVRRIAADLASAAEILPFRAGSIGDDRQAGVFYRVDVITTRASDRSRTYSLRFDPATGSNQLMQYDGDAGDFPLVDHVVFLRFAYAGAATAAACAPSAPDVPMLTAIEPAAFSDGPWCPDAASPTRIDADVLRIRRVSVSLRLQVAHPSLRGLPGTMFSTAGSATSIGRYVPDREIHFDVAPRSVIGLP